jgi:putative FmdB family regulatory protein
MPTYEYRCKKCDHAFTEILTIREHDQRKIKCPSCKSSEVEQIISSFYAKTSSKA